MIFYSSSKKSVFFYIRLHPGLFYSEKQFKPITDRSLEWRQYCLDPLYTNYNNVIQNMLKNNLNMNNTVASTTSIQPNHFPNKIIFNPPPLSLSNIGSNSTDQSSPFLQNTQLSPSYLFSLTNKSAQSIYI